MRRFSCVLGVWLAVFLAPAWAQSGDQVLIRDDGAVAPSMAAAYHRSQATGKAGNAIALVAWPAFGVGFLFTLTDTRFSVASGEAIRGAGVVGALVGVPMMLHSASSGARLLRQARPDYSTDLVTAGWVFNGVSVGFAALTAGSIAGNWARGQQARWLVRPTTFGAVSLAAGATAWFCAKRQLAKNDSLVRTLDFELRRRQVRASSFRAWLVPVFTPDHAGLSVVGLL